MEVPESDGTTPFARAPVRALWPRRVATVVGALGAAAAAPASAPTNPKHFFWAPGQSPQGTVDSATNDIIYHGGNVGDGAIGVQTKPAVYLVYWGPQWATGFTTNDSVDGKPYSSATLQSYLNAFFTKSVGARGPACRRSTAGTFPQARRAAPASRAPSTSRTRRGS